MNKISDKINFSYTNLFKFMNKFYYFSKSIINKLYAISANEYHLPRIKLVDFKTLHKLQLLLIFFFCI